MKWSTQSRIIFNLGLKRARGIVPRIESDGSGESGPLPGDGTVCTESENAVMDGIIASNPEIPGGTPVFAGTRVAVRTLMECLGAGTGWMMSSRSIPPWRANRPWLCRSGPRRSAATCASGFDAPITVDRGLNSGKTRASCQFLW